jgi:hypothetical protein
LACPRSHVSDRSAGNNPFQVNPVERHGDGLAVAACELGAGFNRIIRPPEPDDVIGRVGELHLSTSCDSIGLPPTPLPKHVQPAAG